MIPHRILTPFFILVLSLVFAISSAPGLQAQPPKKDAAFLKMDEAKVIGFLENPQAVYILDFSDTSYRPILLDRSFKDLFITNIDKETFRRLYDEKMKPEQ